VSIFHLLADASGDLSGLRPDLFDISDHVESDLWDAVQLAAQNLGETGDGVLECYVSAWGTGEGLSNGEWLREESLDLSGSGDGELLFGGELSHTKNGNDILEGLVVLEDLLDISSDVVVGGTDDVGVHDSGGGLEWVDGWVEAQLSDLSGEYGGGVQMGEGGGWGWIGQIISWHVDSLDGGNGSLEGGGNSLLHSTHIGGEGWLVTDGGWNSTEEGGHFGTGLSESENVIDKEKHILSLGISEVLGNGQTGKGDSGSGSWGLVHLAVDESDLGFVILQADDTSLNHLVVEIVTLSSSLSDTGEDRVTTMRLGDVVDQLHNEDSLTDSGTTEETNLTTLYVWGKKIDDLDTSLENFDGRAGLDEFWWWGVDSLEGVSLDWASLVDWGTNDVDNSAEGGGTDWDHNWVTGVEDVLTSNDSLGGIHSNGSNGVLTQMLGDLEHQSVLSALDFESVQNWWSITIELNVNDWTNDGSDSADHLTLIGSAANGLPHYLAEHYSVPICKFDLRL